MEGKKILSKDKAVRTVQDRLQLREMELNSLLEITQAINNNLPENSLYKIFEFTLRANLFIKSMALYVFDDAWSCKSNFGSSINCFQTELPEQFLKLKEFQSIDKNDPLFGEFEFVFPVLHKTQLLALVFVSGLSEHPEKGSNAVNFIQALSNIIIVAIENKKLARRELQQEAFRKELEIASDVQQYLFPEKLPYGVRLKIEASYLPHDKIGGDYYDYIPINKNQFLICIADVSGKGIPAAIMMSNFQASLRTLIRQTGNLRDIVEELNYQVLENAKGEKFITFFAAIYDHSLKTMVYVNAGHNPPILLRNNGGIELLEDGATVLGAIHPLPFLNEGFITDLSDFLLFAYTDGVTETMSTEEEEFGMDRLLEYFNNNGIKDLHEIHQDIIIQLDEFKGINNYKDDITILSCRVTP
ncbi:MAG: PP2C family protein-serine/threonine phosphatase [Cyclobacteriaceae bacterium]|nr:PP2C family protein-serine/threonine phosphatase [Cyclobacteriaceae bacterium]